MSLMRTVYEPKKNSDPILYDHHDYAELFEKKTLPHSGLTLKPGSAFLVCSHEPYRIPMGYFGQVQTKGSLARLFVTTHMSDPQIDPGFKGRITLELVNLGPFTITIPINTVIAHLYIWKCSTTNSKPYDGRYNNATEPTIPRLLG